MTDEVVAEELDITDELIAERRAGEPGETPDDMTPWMRPIVYFVDRLNLWAGRIICLLMVPLILVIVFEVFSRNMFAILTQNGMNDVAIAWRFGPTLWVYDVSRMLGGVLFMAAAGYALMRGVHIRADFLYRGWSHKTQATVDATLYLVFYIPAMLFFAWVSSEYWLKAFLSGEQASDSTWAPLLWPARLAMPVGAFLLLLQGFPELFRALHQMGEDRARKFRRILPVYAVVLAVITVGVFFPNVIPLGDIWDGIFGEGLSFSKPTIGLIMLAVMLFAIFVGFPISFTLIFLGFVFGTWGANFKLATFLMTLQTNSVMLSDQLVAVPLFIFMGIVMEQAGLMERLFQAVQMMMSRTRGALFIAVLFVSTIFAAATGIVGASVTILGIMAARTMNKSGYNVRLAAGTITAGGTLGILIPPSIMLIVMGPVLEVPVTDLFRAAIIPGVMLAGLYLLYALGRCWLDPDMGPILAPEDQPETSRFYLLEVVLVMASLVFLIWLITRGITVGYGFLLGALVVPLAWIGVMYGVYNWLNRTRPGGFYFAPLWYEFFMGLVPPTVLIAFALGSILAGWATPAEASACGAFGAVLLSLLYRKFTFPGLYDALIKSLEITVLIMFLVAASNFFGAVFSNLGTPKMLTELLLSLDMSPVLVLMLIMALIFLLGWPLEWVPIVLIIVPILIPTVTSLDLGFENQQDMLIWFAILVAVNLQTAWLSPPVALSAYFLKGVVPEWDLKDIYLGMMQFMVIQVIGLILIFMFPQIALWLPNLVGGL
ncbi:C4-dicarboxylate TRAP transporter large permease protein DctM [Defluviimonas aquaemixtae]|uniref:C4-dicarboxylate TRAP transporter large permease protein DctM n=1 Tax=Albidovulum aquaemixtae TaxID=1542388 RepID=A0A2R8B8D2_9RHOB|nr:TRAP transporter large permease subunit [Defluviimonas aquaemixtae]SPH18819.1 C4-dicarboxylate TRAP transporter large permease protein DctM [Defluviimonas aquaemixtae]